MIASSNMVKLTAVLGAVLLHAVAVWGLAGETVVEMESATGTTEVSLGSSFADMAVGTLEAQVTEDVTAPEPLADTALATEPLPLEATTPNAPLQPEHKTEVIAAQPVLTARALVPTQTLSPETEESTAIARSTRPKPRSKAFEQEHKAKPEPVKRAATTQPKKQLPKGNAGQNAKAGSATGTKAHQSKATTSGTGTKTASGNAAVSNYPGKVMRKISRVPKPRVGQSGTATVAFTIAPGGGLGALSIARSSGSGALDEAAMRVIRRAAPFPSPPPGAQRSFSIRIKGG